MRAEKYNEAVKAIDDIYYNLLDAIEYGDSFALTKEEIKRLDELESVCQGFLKIYKFAKH